jgi:hypothetical protein
MKLSKVLRGGVGTGLRISVEGLKIALSGHRRSESCFSCVAPIAPYVFTSNWRIQLTAGPMSACRLTCSHTCQQQQQPRHRSSLYARRRASATATQCQALIFSLPQPALDGLSGRSVRVLQNPYTRMNVLAFCSRVFAGMELRIECSKAMFVRPRSARLIPPSSAARI